MPATDAFRARLQAALDAFAPGSVLGESVPMGGGVSATTTAFEAVFPDGAYRRFIARQPGPWAREDRDGVKREFETLRRVSRSGLPVPAPRYLEPDGEDNFYVLDYIDGEPNLAPKNWEPYVREFAEKLALIHRVDVAAAGLQGVRRLKNPWTPRRETSDARMREEEIRALLESIGPQQGPNPEVLRHGDYWPGNLLWRNEKIVAIIDWENACLGEPLADLAIARLDIAWVAGIAVAEQVTNCYLQANPIETSLLPYYDLVACLRPCGEFETWAPAYTALGRPDITAETIVATQNEFADRALSQAR